MPDRNGDGTVDADDRAEPILFTVYVVPGTSPETLSLIGAGTDGVEIGNDFGPYENINALFNVAENVPLTYEVEGSGRVFVRMSEERESKRDDELETSSSAPVFLEMKGSSNKVTVWVRGQDAKRDSSECYLYQ